jgi:hypothetical protein
MDATPIGEALALHSMARSFSAERGKLPQPADPHSPSDLATVARQLSQIGALITDLGDEVLFRANERDQAHHIGSAIKGFASAIRPASDAVYELSRMTRAYTHLDQTERQRDDPATAKTHEAARKTIECARTHADNALSQAASSLHSSAADISPPSARMRAARSRSTTMPTITPIPHCPPTTAAPAQRPGRSR